MPFLTSSRPSAGSAVRSGGSVRAPPHLLHADARFIQSRFCSWPKAGLIDLAYESLQLAMDTFAAAKKPGLKEQEVQKPPASTETDVGEGDDTASDESGADDDDGDAASFSQAGLTCEALVETDGSDVSVADIQADAESEIAEAAAQGDSQARDLLDTPEGAETVSAFDLAANVADEAQDAGTPVQTGASYRQSASLSGIYLATFPTLDAAQVVQRASALEGVLFAEADQVVAEGSSDVEDATAAAGEEGASSIVEEDAAVEDDAAGHRRGGYGRGLHQPRTRAQYGRPFAVSRPDGRHGLRQVRHRRHRRRGRPRVRGSDGPEQPWHPRGGHHRGKR